MPEIAHFYKLRSSRLKALYAVTAAVFIYLTCGLFYRQIIQHKYFQRKESRQSMRRIILPGTRGNIYDRNGILLAGHRNLFSINLHLCELLDEFQNEYLRRVNSLRESDAKFNPVDVRGRVREEIVAKYLQPLNDVLGSDYKVSAKAIEQHLAQKFILPMKIVGNISQQNYEKLVYVLPKNSPVRPSEDEVRYYPHGDLACHVIGYVVFDECDRGANDSAIDVKTFAVKRQIGKTGVELVKDDVLHGTPGYELWQVDMVGNYRELLEYECPKHGSSVMLSIDKNLQSVAESALEDNRGCAIVMDICSGEVLAMASKPSYDVNLLIPRIPSDVYGEIAKQIGWMNLATQGRFPLGSIFKLVSSIVFLKSGEVLRTDSVRCEGVLEVGDRKFHCHNHQPGLEVTFGDAIAMSCNTFFYENARKVESNGLIREAIALGFSEKTGIELPYEGTGFVPTAAWKKSHGFGNWMVGDTINLSIGQGFFLATPLEVCCFTASIAANRLRTKPTIFLNGNNWNLPSCPSLGLSDDDYKFIINSMVEVVESKTGRRAKLDNLKIAGKTGTAQFFDHGEKRNLAWFTCFAPVENPEIAVTVVVQEKSQFDRFFGGVNAAPIAKKILLEYFSKK
jgi:penicillin-binding protein 2